MNTASTSDEPEQRRPPIGRAFLRLRRELNEKELADPGVQRLILDDIERLRQEVTDLTEFREKYHAAARERAVLDEQLKQKPAVEILQDVAFGVGFFLMGLVHSAWNVRPLMYFIVAGGVILVVAAFVTKNRILQKSK